jgi:DNA-binding CsgD family transcriptional regulator
VTCLLDDYVIAVSAGVIVAAVVILATLLSRYSRMVQEADKSTRLAKDVWDSVNSRFSVVDARIIDLMAKTDVLSSRLSSPQAGAVSVQQANLQSKASTPSETARAVAPSTPHGESTETEAKVLRLLAQGPRTSAQIKEEVGRSREHTARLMKGLFDRGLVIRNDRNKPYVYEITESGKSYVAS